MMTGEVMSVAACLDQEERDEKEGIQMLAESTDPATSSFFLFTVCCRCRLGFSLGARQEGKSSKDKKEKALEESITEEEKAAKEIQLSRDRNLCRALTTVFSKYGEKGTKVFQGYLSDFVRPYLCKDNPILAAAPSLIRSNDLERFYSALP